MWLRQLSQYWLTTILLTLLASCSVESTQLQPSNTSKSEPQKSKVLRPKRTEPAPTSSKVAKIFQSGNLKSQETSKAFNQNAAEAYYQKLMAQYGENYAECLEAVKVELQENPLPELAEAEITTSQLNVTIALDSSGSMAEKVNGESKLMAAKIAIAEFVDSLPAITQVSLIAFGHQGSNAETDKVISCQGIETIYPLGVKNSDRLSQAVNSLTPTGYTPLAATLKLAGQNLAALKNENNKNVIYLVSDGVETCDGNPVAIAKQLHNSKTELIINVIGFDVDNSAQQQLKAISQAGGGEYYTASDRASLQQVWQQNLTEFNRYWSKNLRNQNQVFYTLTKASNNIFSCILEKQNREFKNILDALNQLEPADSNYQYISYVQERRSQKSDRIDQWRDNLTADLKNKRDVTIEKLQQELDAVESKYQKQTN